MQNESESFLILHPSSPKSVNNLLIHDLYFGVLDFLVSVTSDVQAVTATVVGQSINIRCLFIAGSDRTGCIVLLVSNCSTVDDININLTRNRRVASRNLTLGHNTLCFHQLFAYDIDVNGTKLL